MEKKLYYVYMLDLDNRGNKSNFYGMTRVYYVGISTNIGRRIGDYLHLRGKGFVNDTFRDARKVPVYVSYFFGTKCDAMKLENSIKKLTRVKKLELIGSDRNKLVGYKPCKFLILKSYETNGEVIQHIC